MRSARLAMLLFALLFAIGAAPAVAQVPSVGSTAVAARDEPLPVLDDDGAIIPEQLIAQSMRPPAGGGVRFLFRTAMGIVAAIAFANQFDTPGRDCSIYEPCSDRERWQKRASPWFGFAIGVMASYAIVGTGIDRLDAIERIRADRRLQKAGSAP